MTDRFLTHFNYWLIMLLSGHTANCMSSKNRKHSEHKNIPLLHLLMILIVPVLLYAQSIHFNFVFHDDDIMILQNSEVLRQFDIKKLLFTDAWLMDKKIELYRPWQSITYAIDYALGGDKPSVYHAHNLMVFCIGMVLLYLVLQSLHISTSHALLLTLLYSVHYLFANTVCWIPARGDLYLFAFSMLSIWLWIKALSAETLKWYLLTALGYAFALLSKESAIVLLPLFAWLYYAKHKTIHLNKSALYFFVLACIGISGAYFYMRSLSIVNTPNIFTLDGFLYNIRIIPEQLGKFYVPAFFSVMPAFSTTLTIIGTILILFIIITTIRFRKELNLSLIILGALLYLLPTLPAVVYKPQFTGFAYDYLDHRLLFPATGLLLIAYALLSKLIKKQVAVSYLYVLIAVMGIYTFTQARNYKDYKAYYTNATQTNPKSGLAWMNYGTMMTRENNYDKAFEYFFTAKALVPDNIELRMKIADSYLYLKQYQPMIKECKEVIALHPNTIKAYYNIADYYAEINQPDSMRRWMRKAYVQDSSSADYYYYYGYLYKHLNVADSAIHYFSKCIELNHEYASAYFQRGVYYGNGGSFEEARNDFKRYVELTPSDAFGYYYYGQALCVTGDIGKGCNLLKEAEKRGVADARTVINKYCR